MATPGELRSYAERMMRLYRGGPTDAKYVADFSRMRVDARTGKKKPTIEAVAGAPTIDDYVEHLSGRMGLLQTPTNTEGKSCWGKIDVDDYTLDLPELAKKVGHSGLGLIVERTKNGGAHLARYWKDFVDTHPMREALSGWAADLNFPTSEIFPKQDRISPGEIGSGINLPYFGGDMAANYALDSNGNKLNVGQWLDLCESQPGPAAFTPGTAHTISAADALARYWTSGQRDELNNALIGTLLRAKVDTAAVAELVDNARRIAGDSEYRKPTEQIYRDLQDNKRVKGFPELARMIGAPEARELLRLMGAEPPADPIPFAFEAIPLLWITEAPPILTHTVKPLFPSRTVALLVAEGGAGKTGFALRTGLCTASGRPLFGMEVTQGKCAYIAMEDQGESLRRRVHWIVGREIEKMRNEGLPQDAIDAYIKTLTTDFILVPGVGYELHLVKMLAGQVEQSSAVSALIEKLPRPLELLILDPISRLNGAEENSNAVGTAMVNAAERIVREVGCTVIMTHHTGKAASKDKDSSAYSARGASSLVDAARSSVRLMAVEATEFSDNIPADVIARGDLIEVIHNKCNDGPKANPFYLMRRELDFERYEPEQLTRSGELDRIMSGLYQWWGRAERQPFNQKRVTTVDAMREIFGGAKPSRDMLRDAMRAATDRGDLIPSGTTGPRSSAPLLVFREGYSDPANEL